MSKKNVYDIRNEEGLYFSIPKSHIINSDWNNKRVGAVIYLYYMDDIDWYFRYIDLIPVDISILIVTASVQLYELIDNRFDGRKNTRILLAKNRGRDVAALLVSAKAFVLDKDYIFFLHDKKNKTKEEYNDIKKWTYSMWENTIASEEYIYNVVNLLNENEELGLLLPMYDMGDFFSVPYQVKSNGWGKKNIENTLKLAEEMELKCEIDDSVPCISYGTSFWCRVDALIKLFNEDWHYEDFPEEPLDGDGTISHAIERILPYVAQDAGYKTGMIMTDEYNSRYLGVMDNMMYTLMRIAREKCGVIMPYQIANIESERKRYSHFFKGNKKTYIYGAGKMGEHCYKYLTEIMNLRPHGFIDQYKNGQDMFKLPIIPINQVEDEDGVIIAVGGELLEEVLKCVQDNCLSDYIVFQPQFIEIKGR